MPLGFTQDQLALINLLLRIAVMAGIASLVLGFRSIAEHLARVSVSKASRVKMFVLFSLFFAIGIVVRKFSNQAAMDLSLEGALLAGFLGGAWVGTGTGLVIGITCWSFGEYLGLPLYAAAGFASGMLFTWLGRRGEIWNYSLNPFLIVYNFLEKMFRGRLDRNFIPFALCLAFALARYSLLDRFYIRGWLYGYPYRDWLFVTTDLVVLVYTLGIALKMANNARMEVILREEENQLVHARLTTLKSQVNPHFLFNTLNSISALIRTDPEKAREMTRRLSSIFRKSLEDTSETHTLDEEIGFIDDYLSIEKIRFGEERLKVIKDIAADTSSCMIPSMLLQPVVENAIKHGIAALASGGSIRISSRRENRGFVVEVKNDGPGAAHFELTDLMSRGVGLRNVVERLKIYSRGEGEVSIAPVEGGGAVVRLLVAEADERRKASADKGPDCG